MAAAAVLVIIIAAAAIAGGNEESTRSSSGRVETAQRATRTQPTSTTSSSTTTSSTTTTTTLPPTPPQAASGAGASVLDVTFPPEPAFVIINYQGGGNFAIWSYDASGNRIDLLVNTIGGYAGTRPINFLEGQAVARLEITASGPWSLEIHRLLEAPHIAGSGHSDSQGDGVFIVDGSPDTAHFVAPGQSNFAVWAWTEYGRDLLVNEIAPYEGTVIVPSGVLVLDVTATGAWSVDFS
jgi:hypothetical protein